MVQGEKDLRRLVIKAFHIDHAEYGDENKVKTDGRL